MLINTYLYLSLLKEVLICNITCVFAFTNIANFSETMDWTHLPILSVFTTLNEFDNYLKDVWPSNQCEYASITHIQLKSKLTRSH